MRIRTLLAATAALGLSAVLGVAHATPISGAFLIEVFQGSGGGLSTNAANQAVNTNPLHATTAIATFTYTGSLNFLSGGTSSQSGDLATFIASGGGAISGCVGAACASLTSLAAGTILSTAGFVTTSVFEVTSGAVAAGTGSIVHDDGAGLYQGGSLITALTDTIPTSQQTTPYVLPAGSFELFYVEANGLPAQLDMEYLANTTPPGVPEPASVAVFGAGLIALGLLRRRRRKPA